MNCLGKAYDATRNLASSVYLLEYILALELGKTNVEDLLRDVTSRKALTAKLAKYNNFVDTFNGYLQLLIKMNKPSGLLVLMLMPAIVTSTDIEGELPEKIGHHVTMPFLLIFMHNCLTATSNLNKDTVSDETVSVNPQDRLDEYFNVIFLGENR